jgi:hypothetical protein
MLDVHGQRQKRFQKIAVDILEKKAELECNITPWLIAVWPWSWIQHRPLARSVAFALVAFGVVLVTNAFQISAVFVLKFAIVSAVLFAGLYNAFLVSRIFSRLFYRLRQFCLMPPEVLARWYLNSVSKFFGKVNLYADRKGYGLRELWRDNPLILLLWLGISALVVPSEWYVLDELPKMNLASIARAAMYAIAGISVSWAAPFAFFSIKFVLDLTKIPIRYYPSMPACISLKSVGTVYLQLASLYSVTYAEVLTVAYLSRIKLTPLSIFWLVLAAAIVMTSAVVSQIVIAFVFREQKQKKLVEYSFHLEQAFQEFMKNPTLETYERVNELLRLEKLMNKLDTSGFSGWSLVGFLLLLGFNIGISIAYGYLSLNGFWLKLGQ